MKKKAMKTSDRQFEDCDERVVVSHDEVCECVRDLWDHSFVLWSKSRRFRGDSNAESPFAEDENGETSLREGVVAFPVSVYDHSGLAFSLGYGSGFPDWQWDVTTGALWLWTDKSVWEKMHGNGAWDNVKDLRGELRAAAQQEVDELNLEEQGSWYAWRREKKVRWTKQYENGEKVEGHEWNVVDECGGYLTRRLEDIDFPRVEGVPVFAEDDTFFAGDEYESRG